MDVGTVDPRRPGVTTFEGRRDYRLGSLSEESVADDPVTQFHSWMQDAAACEEIDEPYAMTLATVGTDGQPSARVVLLREAGDRGFTFFTNYESRKGADIASNSRAALLFYWAPLERQIRLEGNVERLSEEESDRYFASRPFESRLGALASHQSREIEGRTAIDAAFAELKRQYPEGSDVPRPSTWGGLRLVPERFEFWQGRQNRLHDRIVYRRQDDHAAGWRIVRLAP